MKPSLNDNDVSGIGMDVILAQADSQIWQIFHFAVQYIGHHVTTSVVFMMI